MKKLLLIIILSYTATMQCWAQAADTTSAAQSSMYCFYLHKSRVDNTLGWLLLIPGATVMAWEGAGSLGGNDSIFKYGFRSRRSGLFLVGTVMVLKGIPFLISAGKYRKRAYLSLQRKYVSMREKYASENYNYLAIDLKIRF